MEGAAEKLAAAKNLKKRLELILEGEAPYDIFVRWKPIEKQPIGWDPDLNDGVRLNIRHFLSVPMLVREVWACCATSPTSRGTKDRGKEPKRPMREYPWFWGKVDGTVDFAGGPEFTGERFYDCHLPLAKERAHGRR